jgi:AraC family transcriptional regulator
MSPPAFFRYFSLTLKTTPQKFISRLKMEHAAELLRDSRLSVADVADATGFANQFHFSRCFKRYYGTAPGKYRDSNIWKFADI